jgi:hypothetical protein
MAYQGIFHLVDYKTRQRASDYIFNAPSGNIVVVKEPTRTLEQNALCHSLIREIANSGLTWAGRTLSEDQWKVLLVSGHSIATGHEADIVPGIESELVNLRESTAKMSVQRLSSLISYIEAFKAEHEL